ncbi:carboxylesterase [Streptomyces sp. CNQ-509]|uniref:carboxylesterase/lipase family protein n=1 Tax=unclassified Streptomyces TaxID=2593676 RepID=UPI00062E0112|nr:carboxylesterase family protein [Streptomyces sp. CNQ-509]AKH86385.1 carboxylesterase [Streptomyces sp. CNQ-509]
MSSRARVTSLCLAVVSVLSPVAVPAAAAEAPDPALVRVDGGLLRGVRDGGVLRFRGVPYARPPVGELRWRAPRPPRPWSGVRDAGVAGQRCAQPSGGGEDCLYADVTAPLRPERSGPLPVIVWLHGGGLTTGAGSDYDAARLAATGDVIVVSVNYRLGVLGFLSHPALDDPGGVSGNHGLMDQSRALGWVRANAAAFGGDPGRVTLAGQSAGARSVCAHLAAPASRGLFQRAVVQSGACANPVLTKAAADARGARAARDAGCAGAADVAACLRRAPVADLLTALGEMRAPVTGTTTDDAWGPVAGTPFLPRQPGTALRRGSAAGVPLLIGSTRDEMRSFVPDAYDLGGRPLTARGYADVVTRTFGDDAPAVLRRYPAAGDPSPVLALSRLLTDRGARIGACPTLATATSAARHAPVYAYELVQDSGTVVDGFPYGAHHGSDLPYLFGLPWAEPGPEDLTAAMTGYWAAFAHRGDPNRAGLPRWRPVRAQGRTTVLGLADGAIAPTPFAADHRCGFWNGR